MKQIRAAAIIEAPVNYVWQLMFDFELYLNISPDLKNLKLLNYRPDKNTFTLQYTILLPIFNKEVINHQQLTFNHEDFSILFEQIDGPLESYKGKRKLIQKGNKVEFSIEAFFQLPKSQSFLTNLARPILQKSLQNVIQGVKNKAENHFEISVRPDKSEDIKESIHHAILSQETKA